MAPRETTPIAIESKSDEMALAPEMGEVEVAAELVVLLAGLVVEAVLELLFVLLLLLLLKTPPAATPLKGISELLVKAAAAAYASSDFAPAGWLTTITMPA